MEEFIKAEVSIAIDSLFLGLIIMAAYDVLRLFRMIIAHKRVFVDIEDLLFWVVAGFVVFSLVYSENDGILRWFIVTLVVIGGIVYEKSFGRFLVKFAGKYINKILIIFLKKPLFKAIMCIRKIFRRVVVSNAKKLRKKKKVT